MPRSEIQEFCPVSQVEPLTLRSVEGGSGGGLAQGPKPIVRFARRVDFSRRILVTRHNVRIMHYSGPYTSDTRVLIGALHEHKPCPTLTATDSVKGSTIQNLRDASFIPHLECSEATQAGEGVFNTCANVRYLAVDFYATVVVNRYFAFVERNNYERRTLEHAVGETFTVMSLEEVFKKHVNSACVIVHRSW
jgi:hypothetical protein